MKIAEIRSKKQRQIDLKRRAEYDPDREREREEEEVAAHITEEDLFDEDNPLQEWVQGRQAVDEPIFDPDDRSWAEDLLDDVDPLDPEFLRESKRARTAAVSSSQPIGHTRPPLIPTSQPRQDPPRSSTQVYQRKGKGVAKPTPGESSKRVPARPSSSSSSSATDSDSTQGPASPTHGGGDSGIPSFSLGIDTRVDETERPYYGPPPRDVGPWVFRSHLPDSERQGPADSGSYVGSTGESSYDSQSQYPQYSYGQQGQYPQYSYGQQHTDTASSTSGYGLSEGGFDDFANALFGYGYHAPE
jgi:hypothetical protein